MSTSRTWIISSGLVGALSLMLRSVLNFSVTRARFFLPTLDPLFIIIGTIFALAASTSLSGNGSDSPATKPHHDDDTYHYDHDNDHHDHDRDRSSSDSHDSSFYKYKNEEEKFPVRSESGGSYEVSSPPREVRLPSRASEKPVTHRRPPTVPLKTFPKGILADSKDDVAGDESETMEEMWERVKPEKQPTQAKSWQGHVISREDSKMSTFSCPLPSPLPSPSRARKSPPSPAGKKLMEKIPSWVRLKKELSMGRDELNSRVEAFISKFKNDMKLQRLESLRRYKLFRRT